MNQDNFNIIRSNASLAVDVWDMIDQTCVGIGACDYLANADIAFSIS